MSSGDQLVLRNQPDRLVAVEAGGAIVGALIAAAFLPARAAA